MRNSSFFTEVFSAVSGTDFEEIPVDIEEFVTSPEFLELPPLSEYQYQLIRASSQIYREDTLIALYGEQKGRQRFKETFKEIVMVLGKGSGKDHCSVIAMAYVVYLLLCLKQPSKYYGNPADEPVDLINVAVNADQARTVFFNRFKTRIENSPWFIGKFKPGSNVMDFDKNVHVYSGHSEREAFEGKNLIMAILDEISAFALESNTGNDRADTAHATYTMYKDSVTSRYPDFGKVLLLSFPRFDNDYIMQRYEGIDDEGRAIGAVAEKEVIIRQHTFKINNELPDGIEENEFTIEWEEDHITRYTLPGVFALRRPSWEVNPTKDIEMYKEAFYTDKANALGKFACNPSDNTESSFFKNKAAIDETFVSENGVDHEGIFSINFIPNPDAEYFLHVDLSKVHDRCAVSMAHVEKWVTSPGSDETKPFVRIDAVRWWKPSKEDPMDYKAVIKFITDLKAKGFNIKLVTFDNWNSHDTRNSLSERNIPVDTLSVANPHYDDFLNIMYSGRLKGPKDEALIKELKALRYIKGKVDHPRSGFNDISDSVCGAIYNAVSNTLKPQNTIVETVTWASLQKEIVEEERRKNPPPIDVPKRGKNIPADLLSAMADDMVSDMRLL